jgi:cyclophilin family peptidyl-prolyl cis-trans isomerase
VLDDSTGHIIQGGDPKGDGSGGPGYTIKDETVIGNYTAGCVAMAKTSSANSGGSQFFICTKDDSSLYSKSYTIFGEVVSGLNIAQKIAAKDVMNYVKVVAVSR